MDEISHGKGSLSFKKSNTRQSKKITINVTATGNPTETMAAGNKAQSPVRPTDKASFADHCMSTNTNTNMPSEFMKSPFERCKRSEWQAAYCS